MPEVSKVKKLVSVWAIFMLMIDARKKVLEHVSYIHYPVQCKNDINKIQVQALIDLKSEVNTIYLFFAKQLGLPIRQTDVGVQKINGIILDTYGIVVAAFSVVDKANPVRFFEEIFLVTNVSLEIVLGILFFTLSSANIDFSGWELR